LGAALAAPTRGLNPVAGHAAAAGKGIAWH